jgi:hypothetical protein
VYFCHVVSHLSCSAAEEEAAKAAAAEAKKAREAEKKVIKKQRQLLRAIAEGQGQQQRLQDEGAGLLRLVAFLLSTHGLI